MRYYKNEILGDDGKLLCFNEATRNLQIEGNIQSAKTYRKRNSYLSLQIHRCGYNFKGKVEGQDCASQSEITKWLENKQLEPLAFNKQPVLKEFGEAYRVQFM